MKYNDFKSALLKAGWKDNLDAQHTGLRELWEKCFPLHKRIEELEDALDRAEADYFHLQAVMGREM